MQSEELGVALGARMRAFRLCTQLRSVWMQQQQQHSHQTWHPDGAALHCCVLLTPSDLLLLAAAALQERWAVKLGSSTVYSPLPTSLTVEGSCVLLITMPDGVGCVWPE